MNLMGLNGWEVIEERRSKVNVLKPLQKKSDNGHANHQLNFINAIRDNKPELLTCNIQDAAHVAKVAQMGNISYRANQKLIWEGSKDRFTDTKINKKYLSKEYHNGYKLPSIG